jgi:dTDP-glucose 4,6-dehydratase
MIAEVIGEALLPEFVDFHQSRPGHDLRYALDGGKLAAAGWRPPVPFAGSLRRTVEWTMRNPAWLL